MENVHDAHPKSAQIYSPETKDIPFTNKYYEEKHQSLNFKKLKANKHLLTFLLEKSLTP